MQKSKLIHWVLLSSIVGISSPKLFAANSQFGVSPQNSVPASINIVTPIWKNFTEEDGSGFYFDLMRMVYTPLDISIKYEFVPWARAEIQVLHGLADALVGSYKEKADSYYYPKKPIWLDISAAAFKKNKVQWQGVESLQTGKVGWIRGYRYDTHLNVNMDIDRVDNNQQAWKMLMLDRLDFYIDSLTDLQLYIKDNGIDMQEFATEAVLTEEMFIRFSKTTKGKQLADIYDHRIVAIIKSGALKKLYQKWSYDSHYEKFIELVSTE